MRLGKRGRRRDSAQQNSDSFCVRTPSEERAPEVAAGRSVCGRQLYSVSVVGLRLPMLVRSRAKHADHVVQVSVGRPAPECGSTLPPRFLPVTRCHQCGHLGQRDLSAWHHLGAWRRLGT